MKGRIVVCNDPHAMRINKELAEEIGFQESVVFLQLEYLISIGKHVIDGKRWTRQSLEELHKEHFPWWSVATLKRIIARLEERNLILIANHNRVGYDRTQWYAVDPQGVAELHSVAIVQNEKSMGAECKMDQLNLQNALAQDETTIPKTTEVQKEKSTNVLSKKPAVSSSAAIKAILDKEALQLFDELCANDPHGSALREMARMLAEENKTGQVKSTRAWRELGQRYLDVKRRQGLSEEAWAYGFEQALARGAPNIGYVLKAAKNHRPESRRAPPRSIAVVGAKEEDYDIEEYRFHG